MKRFISVALSLVMLLGAFPVATAFAEEKETNTASQAWREHDAATPIDEQIAIEPQTQTRTGNFLTDYILTGVGATDMINIATAQLGRTEEQFGYTEAWCADFVTDCAILAGQGVAVPKNGSCTALLNALLNANGINIMENGNYNSNPKPGDIVFFDWNLNGVADHVEIITDVDSTRIYTIGGNNKDANGIWRVTTDYWPLTKPALMRIIRPNYKTNNPFTDVTTNDFFFTPVMWALNNNVTGGTDATHFSPNKTVMRVDAIVFLWAAMGRPEHHVTNSPFVDVKKKDWYYNAVMWAVENKIVGGTDPNHFSPSQTCSRSEILQFLYAAKGKPAHHIENPYSDVKTSKWYYDSAIWAYENGLERGENGKFNASTPCTRAYVVTYLYRMITGDCLAK